MAKIYVGNLPFTATEDQVRALFAAHGTVESVALPNDRETGRPRGFGFVEMNSSDAARAIQAVNGQDLGGRALRVNEAQDKPRTGGGGGRRAAAAAAVVAAAVAVATAAAAAVAGKQQPLAWRRSTSASRSGQRNWRVKSARPSAFPGAANVLQKRAPPRS